MTTMKIEVVAATALGEQGVARRTGVVVEHVGPVQNVLGSSVGASDQLSLLVPEVGFEVFEEFHRGLRPALLSGEFVQVEEGQADRAQVFGHGTSVGNTRYPGSRIPIIHALYCHVVEQKLSTLHGHAFGFFSSDQA